MGKQDQATCAERIDASLASRMKDMRRFNRETAADESRDELYRGDEDPVCDECYQEPPEGAGDPDGPVSYGDRPARCQSCGKDWPDENGGLEDLGPFNEYGLSLEWGEDGEGIPCVIFLISWGGPSEEFRFYLTAGPHGLSCHAVGFCFKDWFDGAPKMLNGDDLKTMVAIWENEFSEGRDWSRETEA